MERVFAVSSNGDVGQKEWKRARRASREDTATCSTLTTCLHSSHLFLPYSGGDWGALTQLFFDNLSTLLGALFAIQGLSNFDAPLEDIQNVIWGKIVPGVGITLVLGNSYYTWMGIRLTNRYVWEAFVSLCEIVF